MPPKRHPRLTRVIRLTVALTIVAFVAFTASVFSQDVPALDDAAATETDPSKPSVVEDVSVEKVTSDEAIEARLTDILEATEWFDNVDVEVRNSVVFLNGAAPADHKEWAGELARNTEGVAAVVNGMTVERTINVTEALTLIWGSLRSLWKDFLVHSPLIVAGLLALLVTAVAAKLTDVLAVGAVRKARLRTGLQDLLRQLLTIGVWLVGLLIAAVIVFPGMTPSKALTILGVGSLAIGFAFKDIFENFFAGVLILWKYPFDRGDFIECGDVKGKIEDITVRMTMIRQVDGELVVAPNAMLFTNAVDVLTNRPSRRTTIVCGVAYHTDLGRAQTVLQEAVKSCSTVRQNEPIEIFAQEFADSSINFEVTWWTGSKPLDVRRSRDEVVQAVKRALDKAGVEIPFPQRTLWLPKQPTLERLGNKLPD